MLRDAPAPAFKAEELAARRTGSARCRIRFCLHRLMKEIGFRISPIEWRTKMVVEGPMVLVLSAALLILIWIVVIFGSGFFGPKTG